MSETLIVRRTATGGNCDRCGSEKPTPATISFKIQAAINNADFADEILLCDKHKTQFMGEVRDLPKQRRKS